MLVVLAHVAGLATVAQLVRQPDTVKETPISVALIELPVPLPTVAPPPPRPVVEPPPKPTPRPQPRAPKPAPKVVTEAPTAIRAETPPLAPPEPVREAAAPTPPAPPARPAPEAPPAVIAARFDAAYLNNPAPAYPPLSRRMREEGKVMLRVQVTAEGLPAQVDLAESSGFARLDAAAREAVQRWRFVPAKQGAQPVAAAVIVPIVFKLEGN
ncbi:Periplasmic biopolymer transport protein linking inner and outer membranes [Aromatoleum petrolei]|nr:Periplasmic biopolymer transport protein linking inner and outer membranes [Aromatoleum petrolei]